MELYIKYQLQGCRLFFNTTCTTEEKLKEFMIEAIKENYIIVEIINNFGF